jgi:DNA mismatch endonuclease vsr
LDKFILIFYSMDNLTKEQRRKNMQAIRSSNTKAEILLAKALFSKGYRYRKNNKNVFGTPDLTFKKIKLAIFVDGEFWHGKDWENRKNNIETNKEYWIKKIESNIKRDIKVNDILLSQNWTVLRFWAKDIEKKLDYCVSKIENVIKSLKEK